MHKYLLFLSVLCGAALAQRGIPQYNNDINLDGSFRHLYEMGTNQMLLEEAKYLKNPDNLVPEAQVAQGSYSYTGPDGVTYTVTYIPDENEFQAEGPFNPTDGDISRTNTGLAATDRGSK